MKLAVVLFTFVTGLFTGPGAAAEKVEDVRTSYIRSVADKDLCKAMILKLEPQQTGSGILRAYLGAFNAVWASHVFNPVTKLKSFNKGKKYIEAAVKEEPGNIEIRFIRLSVQKSCPFFLGYSGQIQEDTKFIHANIGQINSEQLKSMIIAALKK